MVGIYFKTNHMPVRFLIYVAITALTRLLISDISHHHRPDMGVVYVSGAIQRWRWRSGGALRLLALPGRAERQRAVRHRRERDQGRNAGLRYVREVRGSQPSGFLYDGRPVRVLRPIEVEHAGPRSEEFLEAKIPGTRVEVEGEGCNFQLNVISDELAALSPVKRQQQIYAHLNPWIADGSIHAVTMKFFSRTDWAARA